MRSVWTRWLSRSNTWGILVKWCNACVARENRLSIIPICTLSALFGHCLVNCWFLGVKFYPHHFIAFFKPNLYHTRLIADTIHNILTAPSFFFHPDFDHEPLSPRTPPFTHIMCHFYHTSQSSLIALSPPTTGANNTRCVVWAQRYVFVSSARVFNSLTSIFQAWGGSGEGGNDNRAQMTPYTSFGP